MRWLIRGAIQDPEERKDVWGEILIVLAVAVIPYYIFQFLPSHPMSSSLDDSLSKLAYMGPLLAILWYVLWKSDMALPHFGWGRTWI